MSEARCMTQPHPEGRWTRLAIVCALIFGFGVAFLSFLGFPLWVVLTTSGLIAVAAALVVIPVIRRGREEDLPDLIGRWSIIAIITASVWFAVFGLTLAWLGQTGAVLTASVASVAALAAAIGWTPRP